MHGQFKDKFLAAVCAFAAFSTLPISTAFAKADPRILQDVPVSDFVLPVFDDGGHKMWEACGTSATMRPDNSLLVTDVCLNCFTDDAIPTEAFFATSDAATIVLSRHAAYGNSKIKVFGENFCASADVWEFFGDSKKIVARNNVRVMLNGDITEASR
ncbi:MAG: hypothetical protein LBB18_00650 [Puniceicoccales bacterium]|nr:hypothetical protein [Puniceicoccales bacterium]